MHRVTDSGTLQRHVLHADLDTFFVSVERLLDPGLRGRPVVIGGRANERGVVAACSYETRACGVHSGMALRLAARRCPQAVFMAGHTDAYRFYSRRVAALFREMAPVVEQASVDEFYLDLSGCESLFGNLFLWSQRLKESVHAELGLPISMGLASNKLVAKVTTSVIKGGGGSGTGRIASVWPGVEAAFLAPFPIERLPGVGPSTAARLHAMGASRIAHLQRMPESALTGAFGLYGLALARHAHGLDDRPVRPHRPALSVGHERTFAEDTLDRALITRTLRHLAEKTAFDLRRKDRCATRLVFKLRYRDFKTYTRTRRLPPTNDARLLYAHACEAFQSLFKRRVLIRLVGIRAEGLAPAIQQGDLYDASWERRQQLFRAVDALRARYGYAVIQPASLMPPSRRDTR